MSEPTSNLSSYCSGCEDILREAEHMFHDRSCDDAEGQFNRVDQWAINAKVMTSCHLCALLLHAADISVICNLITAGRQETRYKLHSRPRVNGSTLSSDVLMITVSSETNTELSRGSVVFREGSI
jgi:hypothetical protein